MQTTVLVFSLAIALFGIAVLSDWGQARDDMRRRRDMLIGHETSRRDEELNKPMKERLLAPVLERLKESFFRKGPVSGRRTHWDLYYERILRQAGFSMTGPGFRQFRFLLTAILTGVAVVFGILLGKDLSSPILAALTGVLLSTLLPNYYVKSKAGKRQQEMRRAMPDLMDMLSVCVEAGLSLDGAVVRIAEKKTNLMAEELRTAIREIQYGKSRKDAFQHLAERNDIGELKTFAASMIQAEKYGIPIRNLLTTQAGKLRDARKQAAREKAMKAPVKIMIPIVAFIFPVLFIILMGPSVVNIMETML